MPAMSVMTDLLYGAAALISSPIWLWRMARTGKWRTDWHGRFGHTDIRSDGRKTLLIHAVSVGEVNATRQLVEQLESRFGRSLRIVISTTTDTGFARAKALYEPRHDVVRYPLDFTRSVRRFLDAVSPAAVVLIELELWPVFTAECERRGVPVAVVNGRLSERSFGRYRLIRPLVRRSFERLAAAAVQDEVYAQRFIALGARPERVTVTGTMKWDTAVIADDAPGSEALAKAMGIDRSSPLIVCGSTGPGEEKLFLDALGDLERKGRRVQLLMAPRKPERFENAAAALGDPVRRTRCPDGVEPPTGHDVFLLDTLGELRKAYALADVVVVGRSFCPLYGSDMIEPIALGKATVIGPNVADFRDTMAKLLSGGGIVQVDGGAQLRRAVSTLLDESAAAALAERGRAVIRREQGATSRHAELIARLLQSSPRQADHV